MDNIDKIVEEALSEKEQRRVEQEILRQYARGDFNDNPYMKGVADDLAENYIASAQNAHMKNNLEPMPYTR